MSSQLNEPPLKPIARGAGSSLPESMKTPPDVVVDPGAALDLRPGVVGAGEQDVDVAIGVVVGPGGRGEVEPAFAEDAVDELDRDEGLGIVAIEAQDRVVGAVGLLDVAGDENVEVAVVVVIAPLRFAVLDRQGAENVFADEDAIRRRCGTAG